MITVKDGDFVEKAMKRLLGLTVIFLIIWALSFSLKYIIELLQFDLDTKLKLDLSVVILTILSSVVYTIIVIKFLKFLKGFKNTNNIKLIKICYILIIIIMLILFANAILDGVIAFIHYLGLVNYADFEQYQYILDFIRIFITLVYGILISYYIIKLDSKDKKIFYLYLVIFWSLLLLPYILNNIELHIPILLRDSLWIIEVGVIFYLVNASKYQKIKNVSD